LEAAGMRPEPAVDIASALAVLARADAPGAPFSLVLVGEGVVARAGANFTALLARKPAAAKFVLLAPLGASSGAQAGFDAVLSKPVRQRELVQCLWRLVAPDSYQAAEAARPVV